MNIRKDTAADIDGVYALYQKVHTAEEHGITTTGWKRGIYPIRETAQSALSRGDLFVMEENGSTIGTNTNNIKARAFYKTLNFNEIGSVPCTFSGLKNVDLMLSEKKLGSS